MEAMSTYRNKPGSKDEVAVLPSDHFYPSISDYASENTIFTKKRNFTKNTYAEHHWLGNTRNSNLNVMNVTSVVDIEKAMSAYSKNLIVMPD